MTDGILVRGLSKQYAEGPHVLRDVSFEIPPGTIFGYLGRNGAGKSTTVRILATLTLPTGGSAAVGGFDVTSDPREVRRRIGVTMQDAALDDHATARQHLRLLAGLWGMDRRTASSRVDVLLDAFGLHDAADRRIQTFSGGMKRRLDIATALLTEPRYLYLDEPTTGLDPQSRRALWEQIARLRDGGAAILLTTQYLEEAQELADVVGVLDAGRLVATGSPDHLRRQESRTTVRLAPRDPRRADDLAAVIGSHRDVTVSGAGARDLVVELPTEGGAVRVAALLDRIRESRIELDSLQVAEPTLEDAYLRLTGAGMSPASHDHSDAA